MEASDLQPHHLRTSMSGLPRQFEEPQQYDLDLRYLSPLATSLDATEPMSGQRLLHGAAHDDACLDDCTGVGVYHGQHSFIHHQRPAPTNNFHSRNRHSVAHLGYPYSANSDNQVRLDFLPNTNASLNDFRPLYPSRTTSMNNLPQARRDFPPVPTWPGLTFLASPVQASANDSQSQLHGSGCCDSKCDPGEPCTGTSCASEESACFDTDCAVTAAVPGRTEEIVNAAAALTSFGVQAAQPYQDPWLMPGNLEALPIPTNAYADEELMLQSTIDEICRHISDQHRDPDSSSCVRPCIVDNSNLFGSCHFTQPGHDNVQIDLFSAPTAGPPGLPQHSGKVIHQHFLDCGASVKNGDDLISHFNQHHRSALPDSMRPPPPSRLIHGDSTAGSFFESLGSSAGATPDFGLGDDLMSAGTDDTTTPLTTIDDNEEVRGLSSGLKDGRTSTTIADGDNCCCQWRPNPESLICGQQFLNSGDLFRHIIQLHIKPLQKGPSGFRCGWKDCPRENSASMVFPQRSKIERHMQTHASRKTPSTVQDPALFGF
jgi:hypothetical protein